jgi:hypothetical protein
MGEHNMTDVVVELQAVTASPDPTFPQEIEVTFILKLTVEDQTEHDYWLETGTINATLNAVADMSDMLSDSCAYPVDAVNNLTHEQIQQALAKREA